MYIAIALYALGLLAQILAAGYAINLFMQAKSYQIACGLLAIAFGLMIGARISPLLDVQVGDHANISDAILASLISVLIFLGLIQFKRVLLDLERRNSELDRASKTDSLTGSLSRAEAFSRIEIEIERSLRTGHQISFLMLDIDHFKKVNDQYGHLVGDAVLIGLVKRCQEQLRAIDIFGRVGGEEFLIVLPESAEHQAHQVAERLRGCIAATPIAPEDERKIFITISIGIATFNPSSQAVGLPSELLRRYFKLADDAMYKAKGNGRNRCEICA